MILIQIGDFEFDLSERYAPGHELTRGEAQALNGLRAERIRNMLYREIERVGELDGVKLAGLRQRAKELDRDWEFIPSLKPKKRASTELEEIIQELARAEARASGGDESQLMDSAKILQEARGMLEVRREAARELLGDL